MTDIEKDVKVNKSKTYLLPLLNQYVSIDYTELIDNTYIYIHGFHECFGVMYKKDGDNAKFIRYCQDLMDNSLFQSVIELDYYILFIFQFPDLYIPEYYNFINGFYSQFSKDSKRLIIKYTSEVYRYPDLVQDVTHILYKNRARKEKLEQELEIKLDEDAELSSIIDKDEETFNLEAYEN